MSVPSSSVMRTSPEPPVRSPTRGAGTPGPAHTACGASSSRPGPHVQLVADDEVTDAVVEQVGPVALVGVRQRPLERGAGEVRMEHERVGEVDDRGLGRAAEHLVRVREQPLVELVLAGHQDREAGSTVAAGPADLLPERRDRAGEPVEHAGIPWQVQVRSRPHLAGQGDGRRRRNFRATSSTCRSSSATSRT